MNTTLLAVRLGFQRGWMEFLQSLKNPQEMVYTFFINGILLIVLFFQRNSIVDGMSLAALTLPGLLGMAVATGGFMGAAGALSYDREDGTLLRAKAIPQGITGYIVARIVYTTLNVLLGMVVVLLPGLLFIDGLVSVSVAGWLTLVWIVLLGLLATLPWGAIVGALVKSSNSGFGLTFLPVAAVTAISGIFYPISALAAWVQTLAQFFPIYWLGHGVRSAFLPDSAAAMEIGGTWRLGQAAIVLGIWAVVGLLLAPRILRRMAQRESGSTVETRKQQIMQRGY
jgi:ABC-2 type transport system permease protein